MRRQDSGAAGSLHGLEALAIGTLIHLGICLVGTDLNALQAAVSLVGAVVSALLNSAADGTIGRAGAAVLGMLGHSLVLLVDHIFGVCRG